MGRIPLIAGNWKMNKTAAEAVSTIEALKPRVSGLKGVEIAVCPPATALYTAKQALVESGIALGAQDLFWETEGAFTGLISPPMLVDLGCKYVIVGHSERRGRFGKDEFPAEMKSVFGDNDATVNRKAKAALDHGLIPIICCGELLAEREAGKTDAIVSGQIEKALAGMTAEQGAGLVLAYEPVWAIGTGKTCETVEANRVTGVIRATVKKLCGDAAAGSVRIQYGGSVTEKNAGELIGEPEIDGALVGGASLDPARFALICQAAASVAGAVRHGS